MVLGKFIRQRRLVTFHFRRGDLVLWYGRWYPFAEKEG